MTELAARGDYKSARKLGATLQILHPSAELREQVRLFHHLESRQSHRATFSSVPVKDEISQQVQPRHFRSAPAVLILILLNAAAFLFEISFGDWNDPEVLHQIGALEPYAVVVQGQYWRLFTALFLHGGFAHLLFNLFALYVLGPPLERSIGAVRFALCYLISGLASSAGVVAPDGDWSRSSDSTRRRIGMHNGDRRRVGRIFAAPSSRAAREATPGKYFYDHRDTNRLRSLDAAGQHGGASLRINRRILSRACPCAATCGRPR